MSGSKYVPARGVEQGPALGGKVALVTGALSGLGEAAARRLADHGASVVLSGRDDGRGAELAAAIPGASYMRLDVTDEQRWQQVVEQIDERYGRLDVLVNNAAGVRRGSVEECTIDDLRFTHNVLVEGTFYGCKYSLPLMARSGESSIVNVSAIAAIKGGGSMLAYSTGKAAIIGLTRSVAVHCRDTGTGIRANVVVPGAFAAGGTLEWMEDAERVANTPGGIGAPDDFAALVGFLASDDARWITGSVMTVDNGASVQ